MAPQLQINQGPQDALLFDNTRSYFTNVGYVRTSNFQMELRDVDPQNNANLGGTVNFVIPKAADLLGPVDLMIKMDTAKTGPNTAGEVWGWVESLGYAMIEKITFSVGSHDVETITGDHLNIMNELMKTDTHRNNFHHTLKTGRPLTIGEVSGSSAGYDADGFGYYLDGDTSKGCKDRVIAYGTGTTGGVVKEGKEMIIPLGLFFTTHPSKYFPLAAIAGCNDVRISVKFRTLDELLMIKTAPTVTSSGTANETGYVSADAAFAAAGSLSFTGGSAFSSNNGCFLRCHYVHVTGPEATALMNREHVRLMKLWHGNEVSKIFKVPCTKTGTTSKMSLDLSFLHPVTELIITIRKVSDMGSSVKADVAPGTGDVPTAMTAFNKNYFAYHGAGVKDPNIESLANSVEGLMDGGSTGGKNSNKYHAGTATTTGSGDGTNSMNSGTHLETQFFTLKINGQSRHLDGGGIDREYLMNRLMPMMHSNTSDTYDHIAQTSAILGSSQHDDDAQHPHTAGQQRVSMGRDLDTLKQLMDRKEIYVYPFALNPEGANPSGSVNFSKVSHAKLEIDVKGFLGDLKKPGQIGGTGGTGATSDDYQVDVYGVYYNWLAIKDGRALTSFA